MAYEIDQQYLLHDQYKNAANLRARIELHRRFSTNPGWYRWVFDQYSIAPHSRILELGCGPAFFWRSNLEHIPDDWEIVLSDFSPGMLQEAQHMLRESGKHFTFQVIDAQSIPYEDHSFDAVIAHHMLYHVPDREQALAEIRRVLRPAGSFYATTNGQNHLLEIRQLKRQVGLSAPSMVASAPFTLENGQEQLARWFKQVEVRRFTNELTVTETEPLVAFIRSTNTKDQDAEKLQHLRNLIEQELAQHSVIHIQGDTGMFVVHG